MSAPASRPVHPCVLSLTEGARGAEYSTYAYTTTQRSRDHPNEDLPNLVTASASTLTIYSICPETGKLRTEHVFGHLAGSVIYLSTLSSPDEHVPDALLLGFAGHPRLTVVQFNQQKSLLQAVALLDLTLALQEACHGAVTPLDQDASISSSSSANNDANSHTTTVCCVLGGGVAVAVVQVAYHKKQHTWWISPAEPYMLPLHNLSSQLPHNNTGISSSTAAFAGGGAGPGGGPPSAASFSALHAPMCTGFGDVVSATFLAGYLEPVLVLLHSEAGGRTFTGRLGRSPEDDTNKEATATSAKDNNTSSSSSGGGGAPPLYVTALSVSVAHKRTALLWCRAVTADALFVTSASSSTTNDCGDSHLLHHRQQQQSVMMIVGVNTISVMEIASGAILYVLAVNGFAHSTCPASYNLQTTSPPSSSSSSLLQPNPFVKLAVSLDGCALAWVSSQSALVVLRTGQIYVLQQINTNKNTTNTTISSSNGHQWSLLPTGMSLSGIGEVEHLTALALVSKRQDDINNENHDCDGGSGGGLLWNMICGEKAATTTPSSKLHMGLVFAASRLGNSFLLGYAMEETVQEVMKLPVSSSASSVTNNLATKKEENELEEEKVVIKREETDVSVKEKETDDEYDRILKMEEEALYAPTNSSTTQEDEHQRKLLEPDLVPPSDEDDNNDDEDDDAEDELFGKSSSGGKKNKRQRQLSKFTIVRGLTPLDTLVNLGPLGQSCQGPLSAAPQFLKDETRSTLMSAAEPGTDVFGTSAFVFPCGFGSSGGIALATLPGRDDRMILAEEDCLNVDSVFSLPSSVRVVLLGMSRKAGNGIRVLRLATTKTASSSSGQLNQVDRDAEFELEEVSVDDWSGSGGSSPVTSSSGGGKMFSSVAEVFRATLHGAGEFVDGSCFAMLVSSPSTDTMSDGDVALAYAIVIQKETDGVLGIVAEIVLESDDGVVLLQTTPFSQTVRGGIPVLSFVCLWSSGKAQLYSVSSEGNSFSEFVGLEANETGETATALDDKEEEDDDEKEMKQFYQDARIVSVDLFKGPRSLFRQQAQAVAGPSVPGLGSLDSGNNNSPKSSSGPGLSTVYDEDDEDLYGVPSPNTNSQPRRLKKGDDSIEEESLGEEGTFVAVCRQSGKLQVYAVIADDELQLCWSCSGCGQGVMQLQVVDDPEHRLPRSSKVSVRELRFFSCGPSQGDKTVSQQSLVHSFCLAMENSSGDVELYVARRSRPASARLLFNKVQLKSVFRQSQEQARHHTKLVRKGIVGKDENVAGTRFFHNHLHRFRGVSGQDGLFAACARPAWFVAERGRPTILFHRTRHAAPAGSKPRPVSGFCSGLINPKSNGGFLTLHERVGRIGSQRLTAFHGLSKVFSSQGILSGCHGLCIEKIPMGVTVRRIEYINEGAVSTGDHPVYAVLVSREIDEDMSNWNSDGLSTEERQIQLDEKEAAKIKKQVEADLGGFDMESEWVEEIERENCFKIDTELGGAPPTREEAYSLWIVDAANKWMVVDSFELDEYEHALTMKLMHLTEFQEEPGNASADVSDEDLTTRLFIAVGTGYVDHNGEDVSTKGRVLLLEVKKPAGAMRVTSSQVAELSLAYEKNIFHGPVTSLSCLSVEGRNRLVIGAGSDVNIEQWGNSKLTQVGFFRATMQILEILLFKNFFLMSDAFDSLYFLVWRESDKSLTLLAKDYDPIPVYAAGLMSRGAAMTFLCHDDRCNIQFFQYAPGAKEARGGNKLVCRADFHLGSQTTSFSSHYCRSSLLVHSATPTSTLAALKQQDSYFGRTDDDQKLGAFFGTTDGGLGAVVPLSEPVYWRLTALQSVMVNALESDCALSSRAWRLYRRAPRRGGCRSNDRKKGVIDGDFIVRYADLPKVDQEDLASSIGSTVDLIVDNILELQCGSMMM